MVRCGEGGGSESRGREGESRWWAAQAEMARRGAAHLRSLGLGTFHVLKLVVERDQIVERDQPAHARTQPPTGDVCHAKAVCDPIDHEHLVARPKLAVRDALRLAACCRRE